MKSQEVPHARILGRLPCERLLQVRGWLTSRPLAALLGAAGLAAIALFVRVAVGLESRAPLLPFFPAIMVAAVFCGRLPAYLCAGLSWGVSWYLLSRWEANLWSAPALGTSTAFLIVAILFIELVEMLTSSIHAFYVKQAVADVESRKLHEERQALSSQLGELEALYQEAPVGLAFLDNDLRFVRLNPALAAMNGVSVEEHLGRSVWDVVPALRESAEPLMRSALAGEIVRKIQVIGHTPADPDVSRSWEETFFPIHDTEGGCRGIGVFCEDVTALREAREREALLTREVHHRAQNMLAVVQAIIRLSNGDNDVEAFKATLLGRLVSLSRVHRLVAAGTWNAANLEDMVRDELRPYGDAAKVEVDGVAPVVGLPAAQALSLVLHELATNSAKYGALADGGSMDVRLSCSPQGNLQLAWTEHCQRPIESNTRSGFGTSLLTVCVERLLGGQINYDLQTMGLKCIISVPLDRLRIEAVELN